MSASPRLFNALTGAAAAAENFPFTTIEPNIGVVPLPDERLHVLAQEWNSAKVTPSGIRFVDIAGIVEGASQGEGLGNKFLAHIRSVDAIAHVVRCFKDENVVNVMTELNPQVSRGYHHDRTFIGGYPAMPNSFGPLV